MSAKSRRQSEFQPNLTDCLGFLSNVGKDAMKFNGEEFVSDPYRVKSRRLSIVNIRKRSRLRRRNTK